jgi:hypothetical protein
MICNYMAWRRGAENISVAMWFREELMKKI